MRPRRRRATGRSARTRRRDPRGPVGGRTVHAARDERQRRRRPEQRQQPRTVLRGLGRAVGPDAAERLGERPDRIAKLAHAALLHGPLRSGHRLAREPHVEHVVVDARIAKGVVRERQQQAHVAAAERDPFGQRREDATHRPGSRRVLASREQLADGSNGARAMHEHDHDRAELVRGRGLQGLDLGQGGVVHVHPAGRGDRRVDRRTGSEDVLLEAEVRELRLDRHAQPPTSGVSLMNPTSRSLPSAISCSRSVSCRPLTMTKKRLRRKLSIAMSAWRSHSMRRGAGIT